MTPWKPAHEWGTRFPVFFGIQVQPVTLGHLGLLHELGIDLWEPEIGANVLVAFLLSQDHRQSRKDVLKWWVKPLLRFVAYRYGKRLAGNDDASEFREWLGFQLSGPSQKVRIEQGQKSRPRGRLSAPLYFNILAGCMGTLGMSLAEAEAMLVRTARQLLSAFHEASGNIELWTDDEYAFEAACKRMDQQRREKREAMERN